MGLLELEEEEQARTISADTSTIAKSDEVSV